MKNQKNVLSKKTKDNEYLLSYNFVLVSRNKEIVIEATGLETTSSKKLIRKFIDKFVDLEKTILISDGEKAVAIFVNQSWTKTSFRNTKDYHFK